jgi:glutathionylspermidine synthase
MIRSILAQSELDLNCRFDKWQCSPELSREQFEPIRRRMVLDHCKWDPQVGDVSTLARFALILPADTWRQLANLAEKLTAEALQAEAELLHRPELLAHLGLPRKVRQALAVDLPATPAAARVFRFDFHPTSEGWRISEANSDVPGGYTEASSFTYLMAEQFPGISSAGSPANSWADRMAGTIGETAQVALLFATGYMEDQQVISFLASLLRQRGCTTHLAHPRQIHWSDGVAYLSCDWYRGPLDAVVRFYQGEWMARLPAGNNWPCFFRGGRTFVSNPGSALIIESKRFPLIWHRLSAPLPTWKMLLPETGDPREVRWRRDPSWLLKTALCNTGDTVTIRGLTKQADWFWAAGLALLWPQQWVAQRRFEVLPLSTPAGLMYPCLGVYTINGKAEGIYGRISPRPVIDYSAIDMAVLIRQERPRSMENGQARAF